MQPADVIKEITASGLQGRGGAAFSVGRKWQVIDLRRRPAALPDRQRRRGRARHVQGPLDPREQPARAARVDADRELRAQRAQLLRLHPRRVRPALPPARRRGRGSLRRGLFRRTHPRQRLLLRHRRLSRRRRVRRRRGLGPDLVARRQEELPAQPPAAADREGALPAPDRGQQRRVAVEHRLDHRATAPRPTRRSARRRARARGCSRCPGTSTSPACTRSSSATRG